MIFLTYAVLLRHASHTEIHLYFEVGTSWLCQNYHIFSGCLVLVDSLRQIKTKLLWYDYREQHFILWTSARPIPLPMNEIILLWRLCIFIKPSQGSHMFQYIRKTIIRIYNFSSFILVSTLLLKNNVMLSWYERML